MKHLGYPVEESMPCIEENFPGMSKPEKDKIQKIFKEKKK